MTTNAFERKTVAPRPHDESALQTLAEFLHNAPAAAERQAPYLVSPSGERQEVPFEVFSMLTYIVDALSDGHGVTVMPIKAKLTTQQAADHLGMSRPTLVKLLEQGEIPFTKVGRHRRVTLEALMEYEQTAHEQRRQTLQKLTSEAAADGIYFDQPDTTKTR